MDPVRVRLLGRERGLDLVVADDPAGRGVDQEHPARLQPAARHHGGRVDVEHAGLAREHDEVVVGDEPAARAQAVAVEDGAGERAVGERDRGRTVPRLHQARVELVERAAVRVHARGRSPTPPGSSSAPRAAGCGRTGAAARAPRRSSSSRSRPACRSGSAARCRRGSCDVASSASRAAIQLRLPRIVLISPLWAINRYGWASGHDGNVFVENRECTSAIAEVSRSSDRSGKNVTQLVGREHALVDDGAGGQRRQVGVDAALARSRARPACGRSRPSGRGRCR